MFRKLRAFFDARGVMAGSMLGQKQCANPGLSAQEGWYTLRRTFSLHRYSNDRGGVWPNRLALRFAFSKREA